MELRPGYKQTEIGVLPEDWDVKSLGELFEFSNGLNANSECYGKGIPFISTLDVLNFTHIHYADIIGKVLLEKGNGTYLVKKGDILFTRTSETQEEVGLTSVYMDDAPVTFGGFIIRGRQKQPYFDESFLGYAFRSPLVRKQIISFGQGGIHVNISQAELQKVFTLIPPIAEQKAIAAALSDVDALLSSLDALITKKRDMKKAAMQELLTGKTRLPGFGADKGYVQTEVGIIPEDWEIEYIENIAEITTGAKNNQDKISDGRYPFFVRSQVVERINSFSFDGEAVLTAGDGAVGKIFHYINGKFDVHQRVYQISKFSEKVSGYFFYLYFSKNFYERIMQMTAKSTVDSVRREMIAEMKVALPSVAEQQAIAAVLYDMDAELEALEARYAKVKDMKTGMMQELLTGKTRLVPTGEQHG